MIFPPNAIIGMLGGGQLARMLANAAAEMGVRTHIFCPDPHSPAFDCSAFQTIADYDDEQALATFADAVDLITYEFENVPAATADFLNQRKPVLPAPNALEVAQDRLSEKQFLTDAGVSVAPYAQIDSLRDLEQAIDTIKLPAILKTCRFGYDGKGQTRIDAADQCINALEALNNAPAVLETFIPFDKEISAIIARNQAGDTAIFDIAENVHKNHILDTSTVPAEISPALAEAAKSQAKIIADALNYVGTLAIEFFVTGETLIVNEIAPRVHNSGHWTQDGCANSQFAQHIRAILGWPLGDPARHSDAIMINLIGDDVDQWQQHLDKGGLLHLYGKRDTRPGRKMGHVNYLKSRTD